VRLLKRPSETFSKRSRKHGEEEKSKEESLLWLQGEEENRQEEKEVGGA
jgi:hypothetical protein